MSNDVQQEPTLAEEVQRSDEFAQLRKKFRGFVFPMTIAGLTWYFLYVLCAVFAHDFMSTKVIGNINIGLIFGLLQFVSTFAITMLYVRYADKELDPRAEAIATTMTARMTQEHK